MNEYWIQTRDLMHTSRQLRPLHHERWCKIMVLFGISTVSHFSLGEFTWRLVSDVLRGSRCAPRASHDIAGPGLKPKLTEAKFSSAARFRSGNVAMDSSQGVEQSTAGKFAVCSAMNTRIPGHSRRSRHWN